MNYIECYGMMKRAADGGKSMLDLSDSLLSIPDYKRREFLENVKNPKYSILQALQAVPTNASNLMLKMRLFFAVPENRRKYPAQAEYYDYLSKLPAERVRVVPATIDSRQVRTDSGDRYPEDTPLGKGHMDWAIEIDPEDWIKYTMYDDPAKYDEDVEAADAARRSQADSLGSTERGDRQAFMIHPKRGYRALLPTLLGSSGDAVSRNPAPWNYPKYPDSIKPSDGKWAKDNVRATSFISSGFSGADWKRVMDEEVLHASMPYLYANKGSVWKPVRDPGIFDFDLAYDSYLGNVSGYEDTVGALIGGTMSGDARVRAANGNVPYKDFIAQRGIYTYEPFENIRANRMLKILFANAGYKDRKGITHEFMYNELSSPDSPISKYLKSDAFTKKPGYDATRWQFDYKNDDVFDVLGIWKYINSKWKSEIRNADRLKQAKERQKAPSGNRRSNAVEPPPMTLDQLPTTREVPFDDPSYDDWYEDRTPHDIANEKYKDAMEPTQSLLDQARSRPAGQPYLDWQGVRDTYGTM